MDHVRIAQLNAPREVTDALTLFLNRLAQEAAGRFGDVILYGSVPRGEYGPDSDVDLLVRWRGDARADRRLLADIQDDVLARTGVLVNAFPADDAYWTRSVGLDSRFQHMLAAEGLLVET